MNKHEHWTDKKWRPAMIICFLDFAVFPILWSVLQAYYRGEVNNQWDPLTLQGAGLFHMAMGAVIGVTAWSRGREKIQGMQNELSSGLSSADKS